MPDEKITPGEYEIEPDPDEEGKYRVVNTVTHEVHAKGTDLEDAKHQKQLLYAVGHGWKPTRQ